MVVFPVSIAEKKSWAPKDLEAVTIFAHLKRSLQLFLRSDNVSKKTKINHLENVNEKS